MPANLAATNCTDNFIKILQMPEQCSGLVLGELFSVSDASLSQLVCEWGSGRKHRSEIRLEMNDFSEILPQKRENPSDQ